MSYLVVGLEQQHGVDAVGRELWIVGLAEDRLYVHSIYRARAGDTASTAHREPTRSSPDVGNALSGRNAKHIHHAVDLQALIAPRGIENGQIASVRSAGLAFRGLCCGTG